MSLGVFSSLNHSSAGESDFRYRPIVSICLSSDGNPPFAVAILWFATLRNSAGVTVSLPVPENSSMLICDIRTGLGLIWVLSGTCAGCLIVAGGVTGGNSVFVFGCSGASGICGRVSLSDVDSDDSEELVLVTDITVDGVMVPVQLQEVNCPCSLQGCDFLASVLR